ncbi:MAG: FUSC family protein [Alphaproteobacteria bacterium]|nr:MAG: FUSC family protein [Alphaproteobacteria bacterium]
MTRLASSCNRLRHWPAQHRAQLRLCLRVTLSAVCALALAHALALPLPLWTVLTAVLLTQISVGRSLKATADYLASTLGGAIYAGAVGTLVPHANELALLGALALAVAPAVLLAATNARFSAAPFSAVMVFFGPTITHAGPIASAVERVTEVALGAVVGLVVSFIVLPGRASERVSDAAARLLARMATALPELCASFTESLDASAISRIQEPLGEALARLNAIAPEVRQEQIARFAHAPDPGPLVRTLLRLRHDLVMIGRAAGVPLPQIVRTRLGGPIRDLAAMMAGYLRASGEALVARQDPPSFDRVEAALDRYAREVAAIRAESLTREWSADSVERLFALGFTLEQMRRDLDDLARCLRELARGSAR